MYKGPFFDGLETISSRTMRANVMFDSVPFIKYQQKSACTLEYLIIVRLPPLWLLIFEKFPNPPDSGLRDRSETYFGSLKPWYWELKSLHFT